MESLQQHVQLRAFHAVGPVEAQRGKAAQHIQLPGPSAWPFLLSVAIVVFVAGLLFIDDYPWLSLITIPLVFIGICGWALEDPARRSAPVSQAEYTSTTAIEVMLEKTREVAGYPMTPDSTIAGGYPVREKEEIAGRKYETLPGDLSSRPKVPGRIRLLRD